MAAEASEWHVALGEALRERRVEHDLSQERLGLDVGRPGRRPIHRNYVGGIERGQRKPSVECIVELVNQLDGDVAGLFTRASELLAEAETASARPPAAAGDEAGTPGSRSTTS